MPRKARPNTAEVTLRFRVPRGVTAAQVKRLIWNNLPEQGILPTYEEELRFGEQPIKPKAVAAKIIRPPYE